MQGRAGLDALRGGQRLLCASGLGGTAPPACAQLVCLPSHAACRPCRLPAGLPAHWSPPLLCSCLFQGPGFLILAILGWVASKVLDNPPEWLEGLVAGGRRSQRGRGAVRLGPAPETLP